MKILSLLPSVTEIICELGAADSLVGVTHECDFPKWLNKPKVTSAKINSSFLSSEIDSLVRSQLQDTGTLYSLDMALVSHLQPDIVFTQELCTVCAVGYKTVLEAMNSLSHKPNVINIEPKNFQGVLDSIIKIGELCNKLPEANHLVSKLTSRVSAIKQLNTPADVLFLEWLIPPFCAGHWIPELIKFSGANPVLSRASGYSTQISWEDIYNAKFEYLVVSLCGFSVARALQDISQCEELKILRNKKAELKVILFDGNHFFSRPSHRLVESAGLLNAALLGVESSQVQSSVEHSFTFI